MILNPSVIALVGGSATAAALVAGAATQGAVILRAWDLSSASERQLELERRTTLVSTLVAWALLFEVLSLFLYVFAANAIAPQLTGAMCAAGVLQANAYGYPTLVLKLATAFTAGVWLIVNHADGLGYDQPILRAKYALLLALAPAVIVEAALQAAYFVHLEPEVITSCCGSLFSAAGRGAGASLAALSPRLAATLLFGTTCGAVGLALAFRRTARGAVALAAAALAAVPASLAGIIAYVSPYVYELPTHHCPFCLLQREYGHVGYLLYGLLIAGSVAGTAVGVLHPFRARASLAGVLPALQRRLAGISAALLAGFVALVLWEILTSGLRR